jgi:glutathione synthase/RimK-type ligase-like ATP-grasp enzyme
MDVFWAVAGLTVLLLLATAWRMDRAAQRRGARAAHHSDVWSQVRESRRDAEVMNPLASDHSWTSWSRRNRR